VSQSQILQISSKKTLFAVEEKVQKAFFPAGKKPWEKVASAKPFSFPNFF